MDEFMKKCLKTCTCVISEVEFQIKGEKIKEGKGEKSENISYRKKFHMNSRSKYLKKNKRKEGRLNKIKIQKSTFLKVDNLSPKMQKTLKKVDNILKE